MKWQQHMLIVLCVGLASCSYQSKTPPYPDEYARALEQFPAVDVERKVVDLFGVLYRDLNDQATLERVQQLYAEGFYFNDTFNTITDKQTLLEYIRHTQQNLDVSAVEIQDIASSGNDYYIRWRMQMEFEARGKPIKSDSVGITHLRFNNQGQIVLHQDYWDAVEAVYQHLPWVGDLFKRVRDKL